MEKTQSKNGVAPKKPATKKTTVSTKKVTAVSPVIKLADENLKRMVTFQQTVDKLNEVKKMMDYYVKINETLKNVSKFKEISGESIQFSMQDLTNDNSFMTYNTNLIKTVVDILITKLEQKQSELVDKILSFQL